MQPFTKNRPNILFIFSDDQGAWALGCAGNHEIETPNLDRLAATGMRFENFFCASPVCSPARATLLTGRIPSQHGVHDWLAAGNTTSQYEPARNGELIEYLQGQVGYTDLLAAAGYQCALSGKWHLGDAHHAQKNFTYWATHAKGGGPYYHAPMIRDGEVYEESAYVTDVITDNALTWLEQQRNPAQPFYLSVHYTAPHSPWEREQHPADLYDHYHSNCAFTSVPDNLSAPEWVQYLSIPVENAADRRAKLSGYYAAVTAMDRNIGRLLDWLEANGLCENTLVIFTSDNGMNMGHHGVYGKGNATFPLNMFDESVKVPFLASHPSQIPPGAINDDLVSQYDFLPTLLDYVGLADSLPDGLPGSSFAGALLGRKQQGREQNQDQIVVFDEYGPVRMVRTKTWKYVHRYAHGPNELYDLQQDSGEQVNLAGDPAWQAREREMRERLLTWFARYVDPAKDGSREPVTGSGQLGLCGQAGGEESTFSQLRVQSLRNK
ncbi:MAG: sulfatase-like hydrolase/transferase [Caldilineaceae bacterium]|nr:sulfatase-like hydrolase/transferase [Caldilineaceae bacterium]